MSNGPPLRMYFRLFTLADAEAGIQPIRQRLEDGTVKLYMPAVLQYRAKDGEYVDVLYEREEP